MKRFLLLVVILKKSFLAIGQTTNSPPLLSGETIIGGHLHAGASNEIWTDASSLYFNYRGNAASTYFWNKNTGSPILSILNTGNVGIGTANPFTKLDVVGNSGLTSFTGTSFLGLLVKGSNNSGSDYSGIDFSGYSNDYANKPLARIGVQLTGSGSYLRFGTSNSYVSGITNTAMTIDYNGNVGIGTTNPQRKLDVNGDANFAGTIYSSGIRLTNPNGIRLQLGNFGEGENRLVFIQGGGYPHAYIDFKESLHFRADKNWISSLTLYGDGNVGIGFNTTYNTGDYRTQGYKLAVNGGILCEEVKVITDVPNSDHVFKSDYKLFNLKELESFVKDNKHLPEVPSAEEFKKNGYKVGEMDDLLLRKVEELTLYIIELNKKIEALENENKAIKKR